MDADDDVDFAVVAYRAGGRWDVADLTREHLEDVEVLAGALRQLPGEGGAMALVAVDEDFFVLVRVVGTATRVLLSDVTAAEDWELARSVLDFLRLPWSDDDEQAPAGHLDLLADLGVGEVELSEMLDDPDLYPDEVLSDLALRLGFGEQFDDAVGLTSA